MKGDVERGEAPNAVDVASVLRRMMLGRRRRGAQRYSIVDPNYVRWEEGVVQR
jgi:hypothetical protein